ncbi:23S rRNA (guanine745-N1)-methyltransferase [Colwellia chukchiensis]|uniref:23S rRNA (Guanine745-N1)-methyltransferase n=1 Tax=Colwellia chukchiensis TaxID=641665 RepID=A0A1H7NRR1_9GAMM|nr:23S rRNA (guanine(745)-N(1))-methyltransferase [Colwellia chukchiensis]SEL26096.1 23S rRNA (guanine745-N1)-methyltransferase [Colwellia chukchiensis]
MTAQHYTCPLCHLALVGDERVYRCANNHSFDRAKENYVNLLPVQFKQSKSPGDNKAMVNARREFLQQGYYQPLADRLVALYEKFCVSNADHANIVLDAGCGEGFYSHQHQYDDTTVYGVDIAKDAIKKAGKKYPQCHFSVATLSKLPFADNLFSWIVSVYAPILEQEFTRVLSDDGYLITVTPAKQHLLALKQHIYLEAKEHDEEKLAIEKLRLVHQENLNYEMVMKTAQDTLNLLAMTPFAFKASEQVKTTLAALKTFRCQADFLIRLYQKPQ